MYTIEKTTNVFISATKNGNPLTGLSSEWQVKINGDMVELPYSGVAIQGDAIEVFGDASITFKLRRTRLVRKKETITFPNVRNDAYFRCWCTEYFARYDLEKDQVVYTKGSRKACSFDNNDNVSYSLQWLWTEVSSNLTAIELEVESHLILGADGVYHGFIYEIEAEYHAIPESYEYDIIDGYSSLIGKVRLVDTDGTTRLRDDIDLSEYRNYDKNIHAGSYYESPAAALQSGIDKIEELNGLKGAGVEEEIISII